MFPLITSRDLKRKEILLIRADPCGFCQSGYSFGHAPEITGTVCRDVCGRAVRRKCWEDPTLMLCRVMVVLLKEWVLTSSQEL